MSVKCLIKNNFPRVIHSFPKKELAEFVVKRNQYAKVKTIGITSYYRTNGGNNVRVVIIVSKKKIAQACLRNRFRRLIREQVRLNKAKLSNFDLVIYLNAQALKFSSKDFLSNFNNLIKLMG